MMPLGASGRADLVRALGGGEDRLLAATAALLGYAPCPPRSVVGGTGLALGKARVTGVSEAIAAEVPAAPLAPALFWLPTHYQALADGDESRREEPLLLAEVRWTDRPHAPPVTQPLCPWRAVQPRLRARAALPSATRTPDIERICDQVSRGLQLDRVPYEQRLRWGPRVQLILDRSERLVPIWTDQEAIARRIAALLPAHALEWGIQWDGPDWPRLLAPGAPSRLYRLPPPGSLVLVLGDLGCANRGDPGLAHQWQRLAAALREAGCRPVALSPLPAYRCPAHLRDHWTLIPWERQSVLPLVPGASAQPPVAPAAADASAPDQTLGRDPAAADLGEGLAALLRSRAERLLRLVSPAVRIEPGFLRAVRLLLPAAQADVGTELDAWQHPALVGASAAGATLDPAAAARLRAEFVTEPEDLQRRVLRLLRLWRGQGPSELWFEEVLSLGPGPRALLGDPRDLELAEAFFRQLSQRARGVLPGGASRGALAWYRRCERRLPDRAWAEGPVGEALQRLSWSIHRDDDGYRPRPGFDPALIPPGTPRTIEIRQCGDRLEASVATATVGAHAAAPLLRVASANGLVQISPPADPGPRDPAFWEGARPPDWARAWGWDGYGAWASFAVVAKDGSEVVQRLRWIEPGTFQRGSPEGEPGRYPDEGPRHPVTLADGYWLFDTPCTQALWVAVMGSNPSRFQSPDRPVEQVSWEDVQGFLAKINAENPGLALALPTEAQWERACRANTETALYSGPIEIVGENNAPALDAIAWYGGNSGVGFELEEGRDSTDWPEVQHPSPKSGTHPVGRKEPNPWGLYDMLGNVWEWTQDAWHDSYSGAPVDGSAWETNGTGAGRVMRGGSWHHSARDCRCAYRGRYRPDIRYDNLGFRCARVAMSEPGKAGGKSGATEVMPACPASERGPFSQWENAAERTTEQDVRGGAERRRRGRAIDGRPGASEDTEAHGHDLASRSVGQGGPGTLSAILLRLDTAAQATVPLPDTPVLEVRTDREVLTLRRSLKPAWARAMGRDRFGLWAEIAIGPSSGPAVIQRLRWIPPGRFQMGSPEDEPGRYADEGPRHPVTIGQGFWLFDTPCTQALWHAVLGDNLSTFRSPDRPVEGVSWEDVQQRFLPALNARIPGFLLPSEAQWEYACRAGTETALYSGPIEILGDANAPALDPIAWYGGNSNLGFDLGNGQERTWLHNMQYPGGKAGIHPVKGKAPNPWGLYDMLGNVWEWTQDAWQEGYAGAPVDGSARDTADAGAGRVVRGGSWSGDARSCRCAYRGRYRPGPRDFYLGFRCARVQAG